MEYSQVVEITSGISLIIAIILIIYAFNVGYKAGARETKSTIEFALNKSYKGELTNDVVKPEEMELNESRVPEEVMFAHGIYDDTDRLLKENETLDKFIKRKGGV